ncbi:hypothetical protein [Citricoccus sp. NR2]|uniref:hypothetical protein n=1 Tax=Citricoccus sp. NR2 TaxID=3004095 RepID=UPI0022DCFE6B|nr:hypothetical protein [Citricoccus sp. NR2]WBL20183.1 hypothetical protein O1A05_05750 [Citricoccus sp. NR2]
MDPRIQESFRDRIAEQRARASAVDERRNAELEEQYRLIRHAQLTAERNVLERERRRGEFTPESISRAQRVLDDHQIQLDSSRGVERVPLPRLLYGSMALWRRSHHFVYDS